MNPGIVIVDDHLLVREALIALISNQRGFCLSGGASGIAEACEVVRQTHPDVVLVDLVGKDGDGAALIKQFKDHYEGIKVLALSMHAETVLAERALRAGASGHVSKHEASRTIIQAIRTVLEDKLHLSERMMNRVLSRAVGSRPGQPPEQHSPVERLSHRTIEIFELIGRGLTSRQIARRTWDNGRSTRIAKTSKTNANSNTRSI